MSRSRFRATATAGFNAGVRARSGRLRFIALVFATLAACSVMLAVVVTVAVEQGRAARDAARAPDPVEKGEKPVALWRPAGDDVGQLPHMVVWVWPLDESAKPPPGLDRWPRPGEAFLSTALLEAGRESGVRHRYGQFAGTVDESGLASPAERWAIARPEEKPRASDGWERIAGFGGLYAPMGETSYAPPVAQVLAVVCFPLGTSVVVLVVVAARIGSTERERRLRLLTALGAPRRDRLLFVVADAAPPVALGAVIALGGYGLGTRTGLPLPPVRYAVSSADLARAWPWALAAIVLAAAVLLVCTAVVHTARRADPATGLRFATHRVPRWRLAVFILGLVLVAVSPRVADLLSVPPWRVLTLLALLVGLALSWWMLPSAVLLAGRRLGARLASSGRRLGRPTFTIAGRWTIAHPGPVVRLTVALVVGLGLLVQVQVWSDRFSPAEAEAHAVHRQLGESFLTIDTGDKPAREVRRFRTALPNGLGLLSIADAGGGEKTVTANCDTWRLLGLPCPDTAAPPEAKRGNELAHALVARVGRDARSAVTDGTSHTAEGVGKSDRLVVVGATGDTVAAVDRTAFRTLQIGPEMLGEGFLSMSALDAEKGAWVRFFGQLGIGWLLVAMALSALAEFDAYGRRLAPVAAFTGQRRLFYAVALCTIAAPMALFTLVGTILAGWQGAFTASFFGDTSLDLGLLATASLSAVAASLIAGLIAGTLLHRSALTWRPSAQ